MANKKQKGTTTMDDKRKLKTEMSREEMTKLLDIFNSFDSAVDTIIECLDVDLSTLLNYVVRRTTCSICLTSVHQ